MHAHYRVLTIAGLLLGVGLVAGQAGAAPVQQGPLAVPSAQEGRGGLLAGVGDTLARRLLDARHLGAGGCGGEVGEGLGYLRTGNVVHLRDKGGNERLRPPGIYRVHAAESSRPR